MAFEKRGRSWIFDDLGGQPIARALPILEALRRQLTDRNLDGCVRVVADELGEERAYVWALAYGALREVVTVSSLTGDATGDGDEGALTLEDRLGAAATDSLAALRQARRDWIDALGRAADDLDRVDHPTLVTPPRGRIAQMYRYLAQRACLEEQGGRSPEVMPRADPARRAAVLVEINARGAGDIPPAPEGRARHNRTEPDYEHLWQFLQAQRQAYGDAWLPAGATAQQRNNNLQVVKRLAFRRIAKDPVLAPLGMTYLAACALYAQAASARTDDG